MFVIDASVVVHALIAEKGGYASDLIVSGGAAAPHLIDLEVLNSLRRGVRAGTVTSELAREAIADLTSLPIDRYRHDSLLRRIWELRQNITTYDASYVALAERLNVPLLTRDYRLSRSSGHTAHIQYID